MRVRRVVSSRRKYSLRRIELLETLIAPEPEHSGFVLNNRMVFRTALVAIDSKAPGRGIHLGESIPGCEPRGSVVGDQNTLDLICAQSARDTGMRAIDRVPPGPAVESNKSLCIPRKPHDVSLFGDGHNRT